MEEGHPREHRLSRLTLIFNGQSRCVVAGASDAHPSNISASVSHCLIARQLPFPYYIPEAVFHPVGLFMANVTWF